MPRRDLYHTTVRNALIQDGWIITHDPFIVEFGQRNLYVDIGAEAPLAAERNGRKIAVEIKSFVGPSEMVDLEQALGQWTLYSFLLGRKEPDRRLYLAITKDIYDRLFGDSDGRELITAEQLSLIVFDPIKEIIVEWIN